MSPAAHKKPTASKAGTPADSLDAMPARLRLGREHTGLSLRQLAQQLDISASALSQIETGKSQPTLRTLLAIVRALNLSLDDLFDNHPEPVA